MKRILSLAAVLLVFPSIVALAQDELHSRPLDKIPMVWDGSFRHFVYSGTLEEALASNADARVVINLLRKRIQLQQASLDVTGRAELGVAAAPPPATKPPKKIDWSVSLGAGTVQALQYPAIFTESQTTPDCTNDYVAYALNVPGVTGGQANLVGINNLYSGDPAGQCGATPTINWAYNGSTAGGRILVWPAINFLDPGVPDGSKIAYVETTTKSAILHVLTWKAGEGTSATAAVAPTPSGSCTATSSCLVSLTFSKSYASTYSGVYVDWQSDKAWAASDDGTVYEFSCAFTCPLNTNPTINWTFKLTVKGTGGALPQPTVPVYDATHRTITVSDALGELWVLNEAGTPSVLYGPMMFGGGGCTVADPPGRTGTTNPCTGNGGSYGLSPDGIIIDGYYFKVYSWTGNNGVVGASASGIQTNYDLTDPIVANIGYGSAGNTTTNVDIHFPAFDEGWNTDNSSTAHVYFCGTGASNTTPFIRSVGFSAWPDMDSSSVSASFALGPSAGIPCTPLSELYNPNIDLGGNNDHDLLVAGLMSTTAGDIETLDISPAEGAAGMVPLNTVAYAGGTSGVTWEVINAPQASSLYFTTLEHNSGCGGATYCAVKLTQDGLQ